METSPFVSFKPTALSWEGILSCQTCCITEQLWCHPEYCPYSVAFYKKEVGSRMSLKTTSTKHHNTMARQNYDCIDLRIVILFENTVIFLNVVQKELDFFFSKTLRTKRHDILYWSDLWDINFIDVFQGGLKNNSKKRRGLEDWLDPFTLDRDLYAEHHSSTKGPFLSITINIKRWLERHEL